MKTLKLFSIAAMILLLGVSTSFGAGGSGEVKIGYVYLDEEGNQSSYHPTFNLYEGPTFSLEGFRYRFDNGLLLRANLENVIMNNRNLSASLSKPGLFDLRVGHDQFRRIYSFDESAYTRRHTERASLSVYVLPQIEVFGGLLMQERTGKSEDLFDPKPVARTVEVDYQRMFFNAGLHVFHHGSTITGEYRGDQFTDNRSSARDQMRSEFRLAGLISIPRYSWIKAVGGFRHYETKFDESDFGISNNRGYGGGLVLLPQNVSVKYVGVLDRTSSDSDFVATDNMTHSGYVSWEKPQKFGFTAGYQFDVNDDYEDEVRANSSYFSFWSKPAKGFEWRGEYGMRKEEIEDGVRLTGDEEYNRHRTSAKYRHEKYGSIGVKWDSRERDNDQLGSSLDMNRFGIDGVLLVEKYGHINAGYVYGKGEYENREAMFEFTDHLVFGDVTTKEYKGVTLGGGALYYRSRRDLDVEHFNVRLTGALRFYQDYRLEVEYNAYNFDDLLVLDEYYTGNVVQISLIRGLSF